MNFNCGNVIKYLWRCGLKDSSPSIEDLRKAAWYLNDEIERVQGDTLPSETLDDIEEKLKESRRSAVMVNGQPTYEAVAIDPNGDLADYLAARQRMRDAMTPAEKELRKEVRETPNLPPLEVLPDGGRKISWGSLFAKGPDGGPIADEQAPTNLDALANHIDEVVNEFPTEPLDPHA